MSVINEEGCRKQDTGISLPIEPAYLGLQWNGNTSDSGSEDWEFDPLKTNIQGHSFNGKTLVSKTRFGGSIPSVSALTFNKFTL